MQMLYVFIGLAYCVHAASAQAAASIFVVPPGADLMNPALRIYVPANTSYLVAAGSNFSIGCSSTVKGWVVRIGKASVSPVGAAAFWLCESGYATQEFGILSAQYLDMKSRISCDFATGSSGLVTYVTFTNVQPFDLGQYSCSVRSGTLESPRATISTMLSGSDIFGASFDGLDQQVAVGPNTTASRSPMTSVSCSVYRSEGAPNYKVTFNRCQYNPLAKDVPSRTLTCFNKLSTFEKNNAVLSALGTISMITSNNQIKNFYPSTVTADIIYWRKSMVRDQYVLPLEYSAILTNWVNFTLSCTALKNATGRQFQDYVTFTQPGIDYDLDPTNIQVLRHHYDAVKGQIVTLTAGITTPLYREVSTVVWQVDIPAKDKTYNTQLIASPADISIKSLTKQLKSLTMTKSVAMDAYGVNQTSYITMLNVTIDSDTVTWRFRVGVTYADGSSAYSDYLTVISSAPVDTGAMTNSAVQKTVSIPLFCFIVVLSMLSRAMTYN